MVGSWPARGSDLGIPDEVMPSFVIALPAFQRHTFDQFVQLEQALVLTVLRRLLKARLKILLKVLTRRLKARLKTLLKVLIRLPKARLKVLLKVLIRLLKARLKVLLKVPLLGASQPKAGGKLKSYSSETHSIRSASKSCVDFFGGRP